MSDQVPYFAFYDPDSDLYFTWKGSSTVIEVRSVAGAEVVDTFEVLPRATIASATAERWMEWFKLACCNYVRLKETG